MTARTQLYRASNYDCQPCPLKPRCSPKEAARKVTRSIYEGARDMAREIAVSEEGAVSRRQRKKVEMLFAHLKRILRLDPIASARAERRQGRVLDGRNRPKSPQTRQAHPDADARRSVRRGRRHALNANRPDIYSWRQPEQSFSTESVICRPKPKHVRFPLIDPYRT